MRNLRGVTRNFGGEVEILIERASINEKCFREIEIEMDTERMLVKFLKKTFEGHRF